MKKLIFIIWFLFSYSHSGTIKIATSSDLYNVINKLIYEFNIINPNTIIQTTIESSGKLAAQIVYNAPFDIFLSDEMDLINSLYKKKLSVFKAKEYASNKLIMISSKKIDLSKNINILLSNDIKQIVVLNPRVSSYGKATIQAMNNLNIFKDVENKLVYAETVFQALSYTLKHANIGFIPKSAIYFENKKSIKQDEYWTYVDENLYTQTRQGIALLKRAKKNSEAIAFYNFILSNKAKEIFKENGYIINE